jgi:hypothetical protein
MSLSILFRYSSVTSFNVSPSSYRRGGEDYFVPTDIHLGCAANILSSFCSHQFNHKLGVGTRRGSRIRLAVYSSRCVW